MWLRDLDLDACTRECAGQGTHGFVDERDVAGLIPPRDLIDRFIGEQTTMVTHSAALAAATEA